MKPYINRNIQEDYTGITTYFGFTKKFEEISPFEIDFEKATCMVIQLNPYLADIHNQMLQLDMLQPGNWIVVAEVDGKNQFSFKYKTAEEAMDVAREKHKATRFLQRPEFI